MSVLENHCRVSPYVVPSAETHQVALEHPRPEGVFSPTEEFHGETHIARACIRYTLEIPEVISDPTPVIIINGYGGKKFGYEALAGQIAGQGKPTIRLDPPRDQTAAAGFHPKHLLHPERLQSQAVWAIVRNVREQQKDNGEIDLDQFDLMGHSMGGYIATKLARMKPEVVRSIVLFSSAGLDGHSIFTMAKRLPEFMREELMPAVLHNELKIEKGKAHAFWSEVDYTLHNPLRTVLEGFAVGGCDIRSDIAFLKHEHGIGIAAIVGTNDRLLPGNETIRKSGHLFDHLRVLTGGHLLPLTKPEDSAEAVVDITGRNYTPQRPVA